MDPTLIISIIIVGVTFIILGLIVFVYWLKVKSDKKLDTVKDNNTIQTNMKPYTVVNNPYNNMVGDINTKLKTTYPYLTPGKV